ncbi:unnamed protein product [Effrenium voratum]|uniref:Uncharacterized protein n=1 Tax=Effrenium voratum TaxID=2562239 RepID=A0AA36IIM0_9DINO|nr:unnamed protein product [Effrenium voratum]CAJ1400009.1 unnamed protein product [Effrenium voratum]
MSAQQFLQLQEDIAQDRSGNMEAIPQTPEDLLTETCITNRGIFAKQKSWFQTVIALHVLDRDWSINERVYNYIVSKGQQMGATNDMDVDQACVIELLLPIRKHVGQVAYSLPLKGLPWEVNPNKQTNKQTIAAF